MASPAGELDLYIASARSDLRLGMSAQRLFCLQSTHHARQKLEAVAASGALGPAAEGAKVIYAQVRSSNMSCTSFCPGTPALL